MEKPEKMGLKDYARALRLPFAAASVLPFIAGSLFAGGGSGIFNFFLGFFAVICTHLGANLMNDYADSRSGADWQDKRFYGFFGGSKLIQEGRLDEKSYLKLSIIFFAAGFICVGLLALRLGSLTIIGYYLLIIFLGFSYSHRPLMLSYRRLGEAVIFILFGPAPVMGAYFIQTGIFPDPRSLLLSLPFGFFTAAILFSNEVPDYSDDLKAGKRTWVSITGRDQAFILYYLLVFMGFVSIIGNVASGQLGWVSLAGLLSIPLALRAGRILKVHAADKEKFVESSKLTVALQALAGISIIIGILI